MNSKDFTVGTVIRAYDFEPRNNERGSYIEGRIVSVGWVKHPVLSGLPHSGADLFEGYTIEITSADRATDPRIGDIGYIPFTLDYGDYEGRIEEPLFEPDYCLLAIGGDCSAGGMSDKSDFIPIKWKPGSNQAHLIKLYLRNQLEIDLEHLINAEPYLQKTQGIVGMTDKLLDLIGEHHKLGNELIDCGVFSHKWHKRTTWQIVEIDDGKPCNFEGHKAQLAA